MNVHLIWSVFTYMGTQICSFCSSSHAEMVLSLFPWCEGMTLKIIVLRTHRVGNKLSFHDKHKSSFCAENTKGNSSKCIVVSFLVAHIKKERAHAKSNTERERMGWCVCGLYREKAFQEKKVPFPLFFLLYSAHNEHVFQRRFPIFFFWRLENALYVCVVDTVVVGVGARRLCRVAAMSDHLMNCNNEWPPDKLSGLWCNKSISIYEFIIKIDCAIYKIVSTP